MNDYTYYAYTLPVCFLYFMYNKNIMIIGTVTEICSSQPRLDCHCFWHIYTERINPLNAELNPICHLLALLGGAIIVVISRLRVNSVMHVSINQ